MPPSGLKSSLGITLSRSIVLHVAWTAREGGASPRAPLCRELGLLGQRHSCHIPITAVQCDPRKRPESHRAGPHLSAPIVRLAAAVHVDSQS